MATSNAAADIPREIRIGLLGCGFMGRCHTNAYKKIPYIYAAARIKPRLAVLCDAKAQLVEQEAGATATRRSRPTGKRWPPTRGSTYSTIVPLTPCIRSRALPP